MDKNKFSSTHSQKNNWGESSLAPILIPPPIEHSEIELNIAKERLRQAQRSFDLAWFTTAACALVGISGVILLITGQPITGGGATAGGLGATVYCLRLAKDANDRLDKVAKDLNDG